MYCVVFRLGITIYLFAMVTPSPADSRNEFLNFISKSEIEYFKDLNSGRYKVLVVRDTYSRIEDTRFNGDQHASEFFDIFEPLPRAECVDWQKSGILPGRVTPVLIGARGTTANYGYSVACEEPGREISKVSRIEMYAEDDSPDSGPSSTAIFMPFSLGDRSTLRNAVLAGSVEVHDWGYDAEKSCWVGRFTRKDSRIEQQVCFDAENRWIQSRITYLDGNPLSTVLMNYRGNVLDSIQIYRHSKSDSSVRIAESQDPNEVWYFGPFEKQYVDPRSIRISHYGFQEPVDLRESKADYIRYAWILVPVTGLLLLGFAALLRRRHAKATRGN